MASRVAKPRAVLGIRGERPKFRPVSERFGIGSTRAKRLRKRGLPLVGLPIRRGRGEKGLKARRASARDCRATARRSPCKSLGFWHVFFFSVSLCVPYFLDVSTKTIDCHNHPGLAVIPAYVSFKMSKKR